MHDIDKKFELDRITVEAKSIFVHPNWDPFNQNFDADIAVIILEQKVPITQFIRPICLWTSNQNIPATSGVVIGYGKSETNENRTNVPKKIQIFIHRNEECIATEPKLKSLSSDRTFCGESIYGNTICFGDSGHGFFVRVKNKFFLRGIISSSPKGINNSCAFTHYGVYSNVLMYTNWIENPEEKFYVGSNSCGIMAKSSGLVQGGKLSKREQFPWIASIVYSNGHNSSGVLISNKHILMHAGGISFWDKENSKYVAQSVSSFKIYLGTMELSRTIDSKSVSLTASKVILHPHLKIHGGTLINAIAIIYLTNAVQFNEYIRPICLWITHNDNVSAIEDIPLYGIGYGRDESGNYSNKRKFAGMNLIADQVCREVYTDRSSAFDEAKLFCAKGNGIETPCDGDTSLVMKVDDKWYIRGMMLTYRQWTSNRTCVYDKPLLYEYLGTHSQWILAQMKLKN